MCVGVYRCTYVWGMGAGVARDIRASGGRSGTSNSDTALRRPCSKAWPVILRANQSEEEWAGMAE